MSLPLVIFLLLSVTPLFFGRMHQLPAWLLLQGLALAWYGFARHAEPSLHSVLALAEMLALRALLSPWLFGKMLAARAEPNHELMPSNLFTWAIGATLIALAFEFAQAISSGMDVLILGVVSANVAMSFLLLSTNAAPPAQLVALLYMENALALFETLLPAAWPLPAHLAVSSVYVFTVVAAWWLLRRPNLADAATPVSEEGA